MNHDGCGLPSLGFLKKFSSRRLTVFRIQQRVPRRHWSHSL
uniref:Uncharacterized protein n=1 Tax=Brassica campestris TaxID=3711 RepID=A0A3P6CIM9_BRACM|nr:unnamed protein product [Brassica rapa]